MAAGLVIATRRWLLAALFAAVFVLIYLPVIELEQQHLSKLFPSFADYSKRVPSLWPTLRPVKSDARFHWNQYLRNQEYQALLGFLAGEAFLIAKVLVDSRSGSLRSAYGLAGSASTIVPVTA